jgi:hypothetical protein
MNPLVSSLRVLLFGASVLLWQAGGTTMAQRPTESGPFVSPYPGLESAVTVQQVHFQLSGVRLPYTNWGQIQVDPVQWRNITGLRAGYVHLVLFADRMGLRPHWVVRNLYIPPALDADCPVDRDSAGPADPAGGGPTAAPGPRLTQPLSTYFDLMPTDVVEGPVQSSLGQDSGLQAAAA